MRKACVLILLLPALPAASHAAGNAYVANERAATVSQYAIGSGGGLSPLTPPTVMTRPVPFDVAVTPDGRSVYVTNIAANTVSQYDVDPATGTLSGKAPPTVPTGTGPRGIAVSPDGRNAYVANGVLNDDHVSQCGV